MQERFRICGLLDSVWAFLLVLKTFLEAAAVFIDGRLWLTAVSFLLWTLLLAFYRIFLAYQDLQNSVIVSSVRHRLNQMHVKTGYCCVHCFPYELRNVWFSSSGLDELLSGSSNVLTSLNFWPKSHVTVAQLQSQFLILMEGSESLTGSFQKFSRVWPKSATDTVLSSVDCISRDTNIIRKHPGI